MLDEVERWCFPCRTNYPHRGRSELDGAARVRRRRRQLAAGAVVVVVVGPSVVVVGRRGGVVVRGRRRRSWTVVLEAAVEALVRRGRPSRGGGLLEHRR